MTTTSRLFERLNVFSYAIYHSEDGFVVWEDQKKAKKLYTIKESGDRFDIYDPNQIMLAENMTEDRAISFIEADMNIGSPLPNSEIVSMGRKEGQIDTVFVSTSEQTKTERIIAAAAKRQGSEEDVTSILQELAARKKMRQKLNSTVKKKRKFDLDDLDLEDDE